MPWARMGPSVAVASGGCVKPSWLQGTGEVPLFGNGKIHFWQLWFADREGEECHSLLTAICELL